MKRQPDKMARQSDYWPVAPTRRWIHPHPIPRRYPSAPSSCKIRSIVTIMYAWSAAASTYH